jgi:formate dehydrogenase major subunit
MTNSWTDIANTDLVVVMGGNAAEAHPCGFKWVTEARARRRAKLIVVDPRFTRTAAVSDLYVPIRPGTDIAWLGGLINYLLSTDKIHRDYVKSFTNAPYLINEGYGFTDGLFTGYTEAKRDYDRSTWDYELDDQGQVKADETLQDPRCVFQLMKAHYARYTPEMVERITGSPHDKLMTAWQWIAETARPDKAMTSMYALGWTQHSVGSQNIRTMAMVQLLLGNIGVPGGGMNALRGHSNIQGLTDLGLLSNLMPGYLTLPNEHEPDRATYMKTRQFKPLRPGQLSYWQNYERFFVSFQKAMWGKAATPETDFAYDWLPKLDVAYDLLRIYHLMHEGKVNGYFCQGFNPLQSAPNKAKVSTALAKLKFLVVMDPLATETASFWEDHGDYNQADPAKIQTEVFRLPTGCFAEEEGTLVNSSRWLQWHWKGAEPPGEARSDIAIMAKLFLRLRELYRKEGGAFPDPILNLHWPYARPEEPAPEEIAKEINGYVVEDVPDPKDPTKNLLTAGQQLDGFAQLRDDGKTACGCWIYAGSFTDKGNMMARRDTTDPSGLGLVPSWAWSWPANRRILYNRASCDLQGQPWDPARTLIKWNGAKWTGFDVPDFVPVSSPDAGMGPFIMQPEGVARLFTRGLLREGPFPEHYEPFESPIANPLHPKVSANPAARVFKSDLEVFGKASDFPYVATSYRLTELFHFWSKHTLINAILQPQQFVEISEELAESKGISAGDWIKVRSNRGQLKAVAVVTKRIKPLSVDGKTIHIVGLPFHWGFTGLTRKGYPSNLLTPYVGDANAETPEFKAFLVDVEKTSAPAV